MNYELLWTIMDYEALARRSQLWTMNYALWTLNCYRINVPSVRILYGLQSDAL